MQEPLGSPYGNSPTDLPSQAAPETQFINQLSQVRIPQGPNDPSRVPPNESAMAAQPASPDAGLTKVDPLDAAFAQADELDAAFAQADRPVPTVEKPSFGEMSAELGPLEATKRSVGDSLTRAKLSFAKTDWEKQEKLKQIYGEENVRIQDGDIQFRRKGDKAFRALDPKQVEYIDDALDFARDATEMGAEAGIRGGIAYAGARAGGLKGAIAGAALSGAAGAAGAQTVGDFIAQGVLGIPRDPQRSVGKELGTAAGLGAVLGGAGAKYAAWRAAKAASKGNLSNAQTALNTAQELEAISDNLAENGISLKQGNITLSPGQQASRYLPEAGALDTHLGTEGPVRRFFDEQGKLFMTGWDDLKAGISNATGKNMDDLFGKVKESAKISTQLEGKMIEGFRDQALRVSKGQPRALPQATKALDDFMFSPQGIGFRRVPGRDAITFQPNVTIKGPSVNELAERFPGASKMSIGRLRSQLVSMEKALREGQGQLPLNKTNEFYTGMRSFIDDNINTQANSGLAKSVIGLKNELRDDWTLAIGQELQSARPDVLESYMTSMGKYSDMKKAQDTLGNILSKDDLSAAAFADQLFSPAQGMDKVRQMKILINENSPELWDKLKGTFLDTLTEKHSKLVKGTGAELERVVDWQGLTKSIDKLDRAQILGQMFDERSTFKKENLKQFLTLAGRIDNNVRVDANALDSAANVGLMRRLVTVAMPGTSNTAKIANLSTLIGGMGKDKAVVKWLDGKGLELVLKGLPKPKQHEARILLGQVLSQARRTGIREAVVSGVRTETPLGAMSYPPEGE